MKLQDLPKYVTLTEVQKLTNISAGAMRQRVKRGAETPFPIFHVDGLGLATTEEALVAYIKKLKPVTAVEAA